MSYPLGLRANLLSQTGSVDELLMNKLFVDEKLTPDMIIVSSSSMAGRDHLPCVFLCPEEKGECTILYKQTIPGLLPPPPPPPPPITAHRPPTPPVVLSSLCNLDKWTRTRHESHATQSWRVSYEEEEWPMDASSTKQYKEKKKKNMLDKPSRCRSGSLVMARLWPQRTRTHARTHRGREIEIEREQILKIIYFF